MACGTKTIKYLLFFFNLVFALGGLAILVLGAIIQWNIDFYDQFFGENIAVPSIILIVVGSIVFIISFFGCFGAIKESRCMLICFAICMGVLFIVQVTGAILGFVYVESFDNLLKTAMFESLALYDSNGAAGDISKQTWDAMQKDWQCCGVDSPTDWINGPPDSCKCTANDATCTEDKEFYADGCYNDMKAFIEAIQYAMAGVAIAIAAIELIGIFFACCLASSIRKGRRSLPLK